MASPQREGPFRDVQALEPYGEDGVVRVASAAAHKTFLRSNAPERWPRVSGPAECREPPAQFAAHVSLLVAAALRGAGVEVVEFEQEVVVSGERVVLDLVVREEGRLAGILIFPGLDEGSERRRLLHATELLQRAPAFGTSPLYWYAPADLL